MAQGRPRQYPDHAARQRAYRARQAQIERQSARREQTSQKHAEKKYARLKQRYDALRVQAAAAKKERARLVEERDRADEHVRTMHARLSIFSAANPDLAEENAHRYARVLEAQWARQQAELKEWYAGLTAALTGCGGARSVPVKDLITLCHPDKWSQGQPALELAHEIMVRLNH